MLLEHKHEIIKSNVDYIQFIPKWNVRQKIAVTCVDLKDTPEHYKCALGNYLGQGAIKYPKTRPFLEIGRQAGKQAVDAPTDPSAPFVNRMHDRKSAPACRKDKGAQRSRVYLSHFLLHTSGN